MKTASNPQMSAAEALKQFELAQKIPLISWAKQFIKAGREESKKTNPSADKKTDEATSAATDDKVANLTANQAFSRLLARTKWTPNEQNDFVLWINELQSLPHDKIDEFEQVILGFAYSTDLSALHNLEKAVALFEKIKEQNGYAKTLLGILFSQQKPKLEEAFIHLYQAAHINNIGLAHAHLAAMYHPNSSFLQPNRDYVLRYLTTGEQTGCCHCAHDLGGLLSSNTGSHQKAQAFFIQAIAQGVDLAPFNYAFIFLKYNNEKLPFYRASANAGDAKAAIAAAEILKDRSNNSDIAEAAALYRQASYRQASLTEDYASSAINYLKRLQQYNPTNITVCYHSAMVNQSINELKDLMQNHEQAFTTLWLQDFNSDFLTIRDSSINMMLKVLSSTPETLVSGEFTKIRTILANYFFEKQDIEKAFACLRKSKHGMQETRQLQELGEFINLHSKKFTTPLVSAIMHYESAKADEKSDNDKLSEAELQNILLIHAKSLAIPAALHGNKEMQLKARRFLQQTSDMPIISNTGLFATASNTSTTAAACVSTQAKSLDEAEHPVTPKPQ